MKQAKTSKFAKQQLINSLLNLIRVADDLRRPTGEQAEAEKLLLDLGVVDNTGGLRQDHPLHDDLMSAPDAPWN